MKVLAVLLLALPAVAQQQPPQPPQSKTVEVNEVEQLKLKVAAQALEIARLTGQNFGCQEDKVRAIYSDASSALQNQVNEIKKAHGYGDNIQFNYATGNLEDVPQAKPATPQATPPKPVETPAPK